MNNSSVCTKIEDNTQFNPLASLAARRKKHPPTPRPNGGKRKQSDMWVPFGQPRSSRNSVIIAARSSAFFLDLDFHFRFNWKCTKIFPFFWVPGHVCGFPPQPPPPFFWKFPLSCVPNVQLQRGEDIEPIDWLPYVWFHKYTIFSSNRRLGKIW